MYILSRVLTTLVSNEERVMWLKKGAGMGDGACVSALIGAYNEGLYGLPKDPLEAFRWTRRGWEIDFNERQYDKEMRAQEMNRGLSVYRAHLKISLTQSGYNKEEIDAMLSQIK
jgi:hypothetical protein